MNDRHTLRPLAKAFCYAQRKVRHIYGDQGVELRLRESFHCSAHQLEKTRNLGEHRPYAHKSDFLWTEERLQPEVFQMATAYAYQLHWSSGQCGEFSHEFGSQKITRLFPSDKAKA